MKAPQDIILRPIVTEASMLRTQKDKPDGKDKTVKYTFKVAKDANKIEIGKAVESLFPGTKVASVNTMNCRGRFKRMGRTSGYTPSYKKAIVTLKEDSKTIEFFDSMF